MGKSFSFPSHRHTMVKCQWVKLLMTKVMINFYFISCFTFLISSFCSLGSQQKPEKQEMRLNNLCTTLCMLFVGEKNNYKLRKHLSRNKSKISTNFILIKYFSINLFVRPHHLNNQHNSQASSQMFIYCKYLIFKQGGNSLVPKIRLYKY